MLIHSDLEEDNKKGLIIVRNVVDIEPYLKANYEERKAIGKGFTKKRTMRKIGSIPLWVIIKHPELMHDNRALRRFLKRHPEFRCSEGNI